MGKGWNKFVDGVVKVADGLLNPVTHVESAIGLINELTKEDGAIDKVAGVADMVHDDAVADIGNAISAGVSLAPIQPGAIGSMLGLSATESTSSEESGSSWDVIVILVGVVAVVGIGILLYRWWGS